MIEEILNHLKIDPDKVKSRKRLLHESSKVFEETNTFPMTKSELQGTLSKQESTLQYPVDGIQKTYLEMAKNLAEVSIGQTGKLKMRHRMDRGPNELENSGLALKLPENGDLYGADQANMPTLRLLGELCEQGHNDNLYEVQSRAQEHGFFVAERFEGSKTYHNKEYVVASPSSLIEKEENSLNLCKDSHSALSTVVGDVSIAKVSAKLSDKRPRVTKRVRVRRAKPSSHEGITSECTSDSNPSSRQTAKKTEDLKNRLKQVVGGSSVSYESKSEGNIPSLDVDVTKHVCLAINRKKKSLLNVSYSSLERSPIACSRRKLLILDINGLLADIVSPPPKEYEADIKIAKRAVFKRPYCSDFLKFCFERFDVGIWSSRSKKIVERVIDYLMGDMKRKLLFCWDLSHCTGTGFKTLENKHKALVFKELRKIWEKHDPNLPWEKGDYNESNTLLLDDSPYKALLNPLHTAIFPYSYKFWDRKDNSLGFGGGIRVYLEELAAAENVQKYIEQHPFGQNAITERSSSWGFYLGVIRKGHFLPTTR